MSSQSSGRSSISTQQLIIATAGHVDHGKTSLVRQLTGTDTDTLSEEKTRGLTINPGFAYHHFTQAGDDNSRYTLGFVDVPGHADFIHNMLAGVGNVRHALLVVACDDGIMPQTMEHLAILQLLGISDITVALSKIDRSNADSVDNLQLEVEALLQSRKIKSASFFQVNNLSGEGVIELLHFLQQKTVHAQAQNQDSTSHHARFLIDRSFSVKGIGTVVTGTLRSGSLEKEARVALSSNGGESRIRGIRLDQDEINKIVAGQRAAINITATHDSIRRGDWLLHPAAYKPLFRMDVEYIALDDIAEIKPTAQYHLYLGASHHVVNIRCLSHEARLYQIRSLEAMFAKNGDRFVLRDPAAKTTIGGGKVLDIFVPRKGRTSEQRLRELVSKSLPAERALPLLLDKAESGVDLKQFAENYNLAFGQLDSLQSKLELEVVPVTIRSVEPGSTNSTRLFSAQRFFQLEAEILVAVKRFHAEQAHAQGIAESKLSHIMEFEYSHLLLAGIVEHLIDSNKLQRTGTLLHLPAHEASLSQEEKDFLDKIHPLLEQAGNIPPRTRELVELTNIPLKPLERILKQCTRSGMLVRVADNRHYLPQTISALAEFTEQLAEESTADDGFSVIEFRDASGIGRNLCIEILEYFDKVGFTQRQGNTRVLRTQKENIFS